MQSEVKLSNEAMRDRMISRALTFLSFFRSSFYSTHKEPSLIPPSREVKFPAQKQKERATPSSRPTPLPCPALLHGAPFFVATCKLFVKKREFVFVTITAAAGAVIRKAGSAGTTQQQYATRAAHPRFWQQPQQKRGWPSSWCSRRGVVGGARQACHQTLFSRLFSVQRAG